MKHYLKMITAGLFSVSLLFYLIFVFWNNLSRGSVSEVVNLNWILVFVGLVGVCFLLSFLLDRRSPVSSSKSLFWTAVPFVLLAFYFGFLILNPLALPREYVYDFCRNNQRISRLTPRRVVIFKEDGECSARLQNSLVYFNVGPVKEHDDLELSIIYKSQSENMHLGVSEDKVIRTLAPFPQSKDSDLWQTASFHFSLTEFDLGDNKKVEFVFMTEGLPVGKDEFREESGPEVIILKIKANLGR